MGEKQTGRRGYQQQQYAAAAAPPFLNLSNLLLSLKLNGYLPICFWIILM